MRTFRGLPPTGRRIDMPLVAIFVFDGPRPALRTCLLGPSHPVHSSSVSHGTRTPELAKLATLLNHPVTLTRAALRSRRVGT